MAKPNWREQTSEPHVAADPQALARLKSGLTATKDTLSNGVVLISKPSDLSVPPWHMVSAIWIGFKGNRATVGVRLSSTLRRRPRPKFLTP